MTKRVKIDKTNKVIILDGWNQLFNFYYAPIGLLSFVILGLIFDFPSLSLPILFVSMSLFFFLLQKRLKKMKEYKVSCSQEDLVNAFNRTAMLREWKVEYSDEYSLQAFDKDFLNVYGGGDIIIISKTNSGFLMITAPDPREMINPFFTPLKKSNNQEFINQLKGVIKNQSSTPSIESQQKEWTIKKILTRLIAYPFCVILIILGHKMINEPINWKSKGAGFGAIIAACIYLFFDIKSIITSNPDKKNNKK